MCHLCQFCAFWNKYTTCRINKRCSNWVGVEKSFKEDWPNLHKTCIPKTHTHTHEPPPTHTHTHKHTHKKRRLYMHVNFQVLSPCVAPLWSAGCLLLSTKQLVFNVQAQKQHSNPVTKTTVAVNTLPQEREISAWERYKASKHPGLGLIGYGKIMHNVSPFKHRCM